MPNNIRLLEKYFFYEKNDFIYCGHCKNGKIKSAKTILENDCYKVTLLPKVRVLYNFE